jgi:hypothetical protein
MQPNILSAGSLGFLVVNNAKLDKRCKGIIAMEPFLNTECLNISFLKQKVYIIFSNLLKLIGFFDLERRIWESNWFNEYLQKEADYPKERVDIIIKHINPRTFFTVASLLLNYKKNPKFHNLPYFLVGNFADKTINFDRAADIFINNLHEVHITSEPIDHYPKDLTKSYFKTRIPHEHICRMLACMESGF